MNPKHKVLMHYWFQHEHIHPWITSGCFSTVLIFGARCQKIFKNCIFTRVGSVVKCNYKGRVRGNNKTRSCGKNRLEVVSYVTWSDFLPSQSSHRPGRLKLINGRVEIKFCFARLYCMSSQMSRDYNSWVQLVRFIQRGREHGHNSIRTGLLGLYDPALLKERHQSLKNPFRACVFILLPSSINNASWPWHNK